MAGSQNAIGRMLRKFHRPAARTAASLAEVSEYARGVAFAERWSGTPRAQSDGSPEPGDHDNPLWEYFQEHQEGPGLWKWTHYFDIYHRHLARFRGQKFNLLEIGIYSGGSLGMWPSYFGEQCHIHGVDIEDACRCYEAENITVHIGDQEDRAFWADFRQQVDRVDVLIDDGGHTPDQQMVTLEEMLPSMPAGSVYVCEDIHGISNRFTSFAAGLVAQLNAQNTERGPIPKAIATSFQQSIASIHFYPYVCIIEKYAHAPSHLKAPKHGTEWQPFLG